MLIYRSYYDPFSLRYNIAKITKKSRIFFFFLIKKCEKYLGGRTYFPLDDTIMLFQREPKEIGSTFENQIIAVIPDLVRKDGRNH